MDQKKFHEKIYLRAMKDESFRKELKKNPRQVIERELGEKLPASANWEVIEQTENKTYILLPVFSKTKELSDAELNKMFAAGVVSHVTCSTHC